MIKPPRPASFGSRIRCPKCHYPNLAIDIWCERCGTPIDWNGVQAPAGQPRSRLKAPAGKRDGNGHRGFLANLAVLKPRNGKPAAAGPGTAIVPVREAAPAPVPTPPAPAASKPLDAARPTLEDPTLPAATATTSPAATPLSAAPATTPVPAAPPGPALIYCGACGRPNAAGGRFCQACGQSLVEAPAKNRPRGRTTASRRPLASRLPKWRAPRLRLPAVGLPKLSRVPVEAWVIAAILLVLIVAPLAIVLAPSRNLVASNTRQASLPVTGPTPAGGTALQAAVAGLEAKTGLKYTTGSCAANTGCLKLSSEINGLNGAAVIFSTATSGGRQCAGYVFHDAAGWHFVNSVCALPGQLAPLVGANATVHVPGQCANARDAASLHGGIVACIDDGTAVHLDGGPNYGDGKLWWHLQGRGWMAHDFLITA